MKPIDIPLGIIGGCLVLAASRTGQPIAAILCYLIGVAHMVVFDLTHDR